MLKSQRWLWGRKGLPIVDVVAVSVGMGCKLDGIVDDVGDDNTQVE